MSCQYRDCSAPLRAHNKSGHCQKHAWASEGGKATKARWKAANPDALRGFKTKNRYGVTFQQWRDMLTVADSRCQMCGVPAGVRGPLCLDHDHVTNEPRGVLCQMCNAGLGQLGDTCESVQRALIYVCKTRGSQ